MFIKPHVCSPNALVICVYEMQYFSYAPFLVPALLLGTIYSH